jgi:hypothetical protein
MLLSKTTASTPMETACLWKLRLVSENRELKLQRSDAYFPDEGTLNVIAFHKKRVIVRWKVYGKAFASAWDSDRNTDDHIGVQ